MSIINFIIDNLLTQAGIVIGLIAFFGLLLQKKSGGEIFSGTLKTLLGFSILAAGSGIIVTTLNYFGSIFKPAFHLHGVVPSVEAINGLAMTSIGLGRDISLTFLGIFIVNILIARLTPWKYIFLTGQAILWMATTTVVGAYIAGIKGLPLIIIGSIIGGVLAVGMPAMAQPIIRKITGNDDIALGHFCTIGYLAGAGVAKLTGNKEKSTEDLKLPKAFEFMSDTYLSVMVVMTVIFVITAAFAGPKAFDTGTLNYLVYAFLQAVQFSVGVYVLLSGVRMMLAEIVPAFRGIALKIVPGAKPALDCPVFFPYAPNAVIVGFVTTLIGSVIAMIVLPFVGLPVIIPGVLTAFFAGGTSGVFNNAVGGRRGALIGGIFHGFFISLIPCLIVVLLRKGGFGDTTLTDMDTIFGLLIAYGLGRLI